MTNILILEDDVRLADVVVAGLTAQKYKVEHLLDGSEALDRLKFYHFDLAILDWTVPGISGVEVCKEYRKWGGNAPIIMLTGKLDLRDKEEAFSIGADDYLTKPFAFRELAARVRALLRRPQVMTKSEITVGPVTINVDDKSVTIDGASVEVKPAEFILLELLMKAPGRVFTSNDLLAKLYTSESEATEEAIRQRVFRLRKVLDGCSLAVKTIPGLGYKLEVEE